SGLANLPDGGEQDPQQDQDQRHDNDGNSPVPHDEFSSVVEMQVTLTAGDGDQGFENLWADRWGDVASATVGESDVCNHHGRANPQASRSVPPADLVLDADIRLIFGVEPSHGGMPRGNPRAAIPIRFNEQNRVRRAVADVLEADGSIEPKYATTPIFL